MQRKLAERHGSEALQRRWQHVRHACDTTWWHVSVVYCMQSCEAHLDALQLLRILFAVRSIRSWLGCHRFAHMPRGL